MKYVFYAYGTCICYRVEWYFPLLIKCNTDDTITNKTQKNVFDISGMHSKKLYKITHNEVLTINGYVRSPVTAKATNIISLSINILCKYYFPLCCHISLQW